MRKLKYGKIAIVVSLTVLIWVWADLTLDETPPARLAVIVVDESTDQKLWVSFSQKPSVDIKVTLSGPHSAFVALEGKLPTEGKTIRFVFDPVAEKMTEPPGRPLQVLDFLQKDRELKQLGLKIKSCDHEVVDVNVVALVERTLPVECFNEEGHSFKAENNPSVTMFVPEGARTAQVRLSDSEISQARLAPIEETPYVILAEGEIRQAETTVKIKLPPEEEQLTDYFVAPTLAIASSPIVEVQYRVEVLNIDEVISSRIAIRATQEAKEAYEAQPYPRMTLYILDDDANKATEEQSRAVVYNFPPQYVRNGEIELKYPEQPEEVKFKLILLTPPEAPPTGVE